MLGKRASAIDLYKGQIFCRFAQYRFNAICLQQSAADTNANITAIAGAVQDTLTAEARGDLFANIQNVVTGKMTAEEAIDSALALN